MEKRQMPTFVESVEAFVNTYGEVRQVTVTLANGLRFTTSVDDAPKVGDRLSVTLSSVGGSVLPPLADRILDAATMRVPFDKAGYVG